MRAFVGTYSPFIYADVSAGKAPSSTASRCGTGRQGGEGEVVEYDGKRRRCMPEASACTKSGAPHLVY